MSPFARTTRGTRCVRTTGDGLGGFPGRCDFRRKPLSFCDRQFPVFIPDEVIILLSRPDPPRLRVSLDRAALSVSLLSWLAGWHAVSRQSQLPVSYPVML